MAKIRKKTDVVGAARPKDVDEKRIEDFAGQANYGPEAGQVESNLDPNARRDYKALRVPFNEHEYNILNEAAKKVGRSKVNFIRWAVLLAAEKDDT